MRFLDFSGALTIPAQSQRQLGRQLMGLGAGGVVYCPTLESIRTGRIRKCELKLHVGVLLELVLECVVGPWQHLQLTLF